MVDSSRYFHLALVAFFSIICSGDAFISHCTSRKNNNSLQRPIFPYTSKQEAKSNNAKEKSDGIRTLKDIDFDAIKIPDSADDILKNLISPAPESYVIINEIVLRMNQSKSERGFCHCINDLEALSHQLVKRGYAVVIERDEVDKSKWLWHTTAEAEAKIVVRGNDCDIRAAEEQLKSSKSNYQSMTVLELAHLASSQDVKAATQFAHHIEKRMRLALGSDLRGRTSADAAFQLALSGVRENHQVFDSFIDIGIYELRRVGSRSSFQSKYILQMVEKFAASGIENPRMMRFYEIAGQLLKAKNFRDKDLIDSLLNQNFGMHYDRPLLWLWRYSARQSKISSKVISTTTHQTYDWKCHFRDADRDLVVDVGCGMCASLINLSTISKPQNESESLPHSILSDIEWETCNYAGTDLNQKFIAYGKGVLSRRDQDCRDRVHLCSIPALKFLSDLQSYPGKVKLISIHFPTPYKIDSEEGNPQLPNMEHGGFMITYEVANEISLLMKKHRSIFLFQTKCEDVAIYTKNLMSKVDQNIRCIPRPNHIKSIDELYQSNNGVPQRVTKWMAGIDEIERAEGKDWSSVSLLPKFGRPETEINCDYQNTVVHRCLFEYHDSQI